MECIEMENKNFRFKKEENIQLSLDMFEYEGNDGRGYEWYYKGDSCSYYIYIAIQYNTGKWIFNVEDGNLTFNNETGDGFDSAYECLEEIIRLSIENKFIKNVIKELFKYE